MYVQWITKKIFKVTLKVLNDIKIYVILKNTWSEDNLAWKIKTYFILVIIQGKYIC